MEGENPDAFLHSISRYYQLLPGPELLTCIGQNS